MDIQALITSSGGHFDPNTPLWQHTQPWFGVINSLQMSGVLDAADLEQHAQSTVWLVPRVEHILPLRAAYAAVVKNRHAQAMRMPMVYSVDRLSEGGDAITRLKLLSAIDGVLKQHAGLCGGLAAAERWALAHEYCQLAVQYLLRQPDSVEHLEHYRSLVTAAAPETSIIETIASVYGEELATLLPMIPNDAAWHVATQLVWVWDGEPLAQWWVSRYATNKQSHLVDARVDFSVLESWAPLTHGCKVLVAPDPEHEALMAAQQVLEWLNATPEGSCASIAIAVVDRALARRVRARLEQCNVLIDDRTGWRISTTRAAAWVLAWIEFAGNTGVNTFLKLLESHWYDDSAWLNNVALYGALHARWVRLGLGASWPLIESAALALINQTEFVGQARDSWRGFAGAVAAWLTFQNDCQERSLSGWACATLQLVREVSGPTKFEADLAGQAVLRVLRRASRADLHEMANANQWLVVFKHLCEQERFRAQDVASPVRMLPLLSLRLQRFDRVLVLGSASRHFLPSPPGLLPPAVAAQLCLPGAMQARDQAIGALVEVMCTTPCSALTFSENTAGQTEQLLGVLERLKLYWMRQSLVNKQWLIRLESLVVTGVSKFTQAPSQVLPGGGGSGGGGLKFSVAALSDLAICPLRFALLRALRWSDVLEPKSQTDARDRGQLVHAVIEAFHRRVPYEQLLAMHPDALLLALNASLEHVWSRYPTVQQAMMFGERWQWARVARSTLLALIERAKQGWRVVAQEQALERVTQFGLNNTFLTVYGRCDRIEQNTEQFAVIDVKTGNANKFKKQAKAPMSFIQLPAYQWLLNQNNTDIAYLNIDTEHAQWIAVPAPDDELGVQWGALWVEHLQVTLARVFDDQEPVRPLPSDACVTCNVAGSCRAAWWGGRA